MLTKHSLLKIEIVATLILLIALFVTNINFVLAQQNTEKGLAVTINAYTQHSNNVQLIGIQGTVYDSSTCQPTLAKVAIQISKDNNIVYTISTVTTSHDGIYNDTGYRVTEAGTFNITATATSGGYNASASTTIFCQYFENLADILSEYYFPLIIVSISLMYFIFLIYMITKEEHNPDPQTKDFKGELYERHEQPKKGKFENFRDYFKSNRKFDFFISCNMFVAIQFVFLTVFTLTIILMLFFIPSPIGVKSPIGLVLNTFGNETQWVINVGGERLSESAQYIGGIQVPIYVVVLSFLGAYVFFLNKVPKLVKLEHKKLADDSIRYLVRFFIAPLLAIALYLVLWQLEVRGTFILAAVSFATGLIIEDVSKRILKFAKDTIGSKENEPYEEATTDEKDSKKPK